jgi:glycosyltransferase involved in cell wall biosynthesis
MSNALCEAGVDVSIIICTRNRASFLRDTLASLQSTRVPEDWCVELLIVDNGSTDRTQEVISNINLAPLRVRPLEEPQPGVSHAKNTALRHAKGDVLLFTDDDVRVPSEWIPKMTAPVRAEQADAVAGGVQLAPHLERSWQADDPWITSPLATTAVLDADEPQRLVGANMALSKDVFEYIPRFDPNLGPGSDLGLGEETLLTHQIKRHGFEIASAFDVTVEHHCAAHRLSRTSYLQAAEKIGRSQGYIDYHWNHASVRPLQLLAELGVHYGKLAVGRLLRSHELRTEGLPRWEMALLTEIYHRRQLFIERKRARKYPNTTRKPAALDGAAERASPLVGAPSVDAYQ